MDQLLRAVTLSGALVMLAAMASLHILRPDLNPFSEPKSYYGPGAFGALFTVSVGAFGVGLTALGMLLRRQERSPVAVTFVGMAAAAAFVVAAFNADLPNGPHTPAPAELSGGALRLQVGPPERAHPA